MTLKITHHKATAPEAYVMKLEGKEIGFTYKHKKGFTFHGHKHVIGAMQIEKPTMKALKEAIDEALPDETVGKLVADQYDETVTAEDDVDSPEFLAHLEQQAAIATYQADIEAYGKAA